MRNALDLRYCLLPFMYSLGHKAWADGSPIVRPLMMDFTNDSSVAYIADQYTLGGRLMAAPVMQKGATTRAVQLPTTMGKDGGKLLWFEFNSTTAYAAFESPLVVPVTLSSSPLYVLQGTVLPLAPPGLQYTDALPGGPLAVQIYAGEDAHFLLSEDDGESHAYRAGGTRTVFLEWIESSSMLRWTVSGHDAVSNSDQLFTQLQATVFRAGAETPSVSEVTDLMTGGELEFPPPGPFAI